MDVIVVLQVAENKCWSCGQAFSSNTELCSHLHAVENYLIEGKIQWEDDVYLKPFMEDDSLLHSLSMDDDEGDEECGTSVQRGQCSEGNGVLAAPPGNKLSTLPEGTGSDISARFETNDSQLKVARASVNARAIITVDDNYFGSYSSFGIHREMLGDKVGELSLVMWSTCSCLLSLSIHFQYVVVWSEKTECCE